MAVPEVLHGLDVLVVDDNATNRRILYETLVRWRMKPVLAESGARALEIMERFALTGDRFALILLDVQMPEMDGFTLAKRIREDSKLTGPQIMMLSSLDINAVGQQLRETGHYLVKPVTRANLLAMILRVLGERPQWPPPPRVEDRARIGKSLRILLAEDNVVNQKVATNLLEKQGHSVVVTSSGAEALSAYRRESFDLILMDVQMPEMNGYDATQAIRATEKGTGRHVPIVALTAHALKGDREGCLDKGMDDYLSKPIHRQELIDLLDRLGQTASPSPIYQ